MRRNRFNPSTFVGCPHEGFSAQPARTVAGRESTRMAERGHQRPIRPSETVVGQHAQRESHFAQIRGVRVA